MAEIIPLKLSAAAALRMIRQLAQETERIVIITHAQQRQKQRMITRRQVELCVQKGVITEGPFMNMHGNWQVNLTRMAAGEEITCTVAIEWSEKIIVITVY